MLPLKIKIFLREMLQNKIQTGEQQHKRKGPGEENCLLCGINETADHVVFQCVMAQFLWAVIKEALGWDKAPVSSSDFGQNWVNGSSQKRRGLYWFGLWAVDWTVRRIRNKMIIEKKTFTHPVEAIYKLIANLQLWKPVLTEEERKTVDHGVVMLRDRVKTMRR